MSIRYVNLLIVFVLNFGSTQVQGMFEYFKGERDARQLQRSVRGGDVEAAQSRARTLQQPERSEDQKKKDLSILNEPDEEGRTTLWYAAGQDKEGFDEVVQILIDLGMDVNQADNNGTTPLMQAAASGLLGSLQNLLSASGIDVNAVNSEGKTALDFTRDQFKYAELVDSEAKTSKQLATEAAKLKKAVPKELAEEAAKKKKKPLPTPPPKKATVSVVTLQKTLSSLQMTLAELTASLAQLS